MLVKAIITLSRAKDERMGIWRQFCIELESILHKHHINP